MQGEEKFQHEKQLDEDGVVPAKEMIEVNLSEEVVEHKFNGEAIEVDYEVEWKYNAIGDEYNMDDQYDLPFSIYGK